MHNLERSLAVYVDNVRIHWRGRQWCHLVADSMEELHAFAWRLGLKRSWFQATASYPHYDVTVLARERSLELGACEGSRAQMIACAKKLRAELRGSVMCPAEQLSLFL